MKISVIGAGYVGLVTSVCFAEMGHTVVCVDKDKHKIEQLQKSIPTIYERGLSEMLKRQKEGKRISFTTSIKKAIQETKMVFVAVGTPPDLDHSANLKSLKTVAKEFAQHLNNEKVFVIKSTVPVGTADTCKKIISKELKNNKNSIAFSVVSNPEFLREGTAIKDSLNPDRIVIGTNSSQAEKHMYELYRPLIRMGIPFFVTNHVDAELIKYAANAFLATKISFINEIANFCDTVGGDIRVIAQGIGMDQRIGKRFLHAGVGYGGSCFPKDIKALIQMGKKHKAPLNIIHSVDKTNEKQKLIVIQKLKKLYPKLSKKRIGVLGLSFKPRTDDIREAPSIHAIKELLKKGAMVQAYDPIAVPNTQDALKHKNLSFAHDPYKAAKNADALVIFTEWPEFIGLDLEKIKKQMSHPIIIDGRNIFERGYMESKGFTYVAIGR